MLTRFIYRAGPYNFNKITDEIYMFNLKSTIIFFVRHDKFKKCVIHKAVSVKAHCRKETISAWTGDNK